MNNWTWCALGLFALQTMASAASLVTDETIERQKKLTKTMKLSNGIPVILRQEPGSDIVAFNVSFAWGAKDLPSERKVIPEWMMANVPLASRSYSKDKVYALIEKHALSISCSGGMERSGCRLGTTNDSWSEALPLFASLVREPTFGTKDAEITRDRLMASKEAAMQNPERYVNDVVNRVFYPKDHPYYSQPADAIASLKKLKVADLSKAYGAVRDARRMHLVVVSSMDEKKLMKDLEKSFGLIKKGPQRKGKKVSPPTFDVKTSYSFEARDIPTAYIRMKFNTPGISDADATAAHLMTEVLRRELDLEIRTNRSLSYSVYAYGIQYSIGIGLISASTSKPKETIEAIHQVVAALKSRKFKEGELDQFKRVFATRYFLKQEAHGSLASTLAQSHHYFGNTNHAYEMPQRLGRVTGEDVTRMARQLLNHFRVGVVYDRNKFEDQWAQKFVRASI